MLRVLWIAAAVGCGGSSPPTAPAAAPVAVVDAGVASGAPALDEDLPRLAQRSLAMYHDVARALTASGQSCAAATAKLRTLAAGYRDVVTANAKVLHDGRARELRAALDPHGEDFDRSAQAIVTSPTMSRCSQDPGFARAFDDLLEAPP